MKLIHNKHYQEGYTLIELGIAITLITLLLSFITVNLVRAKHSSSLSTSVDALTSDLRLQQLKAMTADTEGRGVSTPYSIHFGSTSYVLYHGSSYNANDSTNFTVQLGDLIQETTTFPSSSVIFTNGTGEISGFANGSNTITLTDTQANIQKTITLNALGVVTGIN